VERPWPGVHRVGDTLAALSPDNTYDLIVASHVIEHLADPLGVVRTMGGHLRPGGLLYVEVPMEIWGRPPLQSEPLTHINFFTATSLRYLLEAAGLTVRQCRLASSRHPGGRRYAAIKAVAVRAADGPPPAPPEPPGPGEAERFLSARPWRRLQCALRCPRVAASALRERLMGPRR
jgi:SAM-dependent methyltransferase